VNRMSREEVEQRRLEILRADSAEAWALERRLKEIHTRKMTWSQVDQEEEDDERLEEATQSFMSWIQRAAEIQGDQEQVDFLDEQEVTMSHSPEAWRQWGPAWLGFLEERASRRATQAPERVPVTRAQRRVANRVEIRVRRGGRGNRQ